MGNPEELARAAKMARHYRRMGVPLEDLQAEAALGLLEAARRFDPARGIPFLAYASWRIKKRLREAVASQHGVVRIPRSQVERLRVLRHAREGLRARLLREPTTAELAEGAGLTVAEVDRLERLRGRDVHLDDPILAGSSLTFGDVLAAPGTRRGLDRALIHESTLDRLNRLLDRLPPRDATILRLRFGLGLLAPRTLAEIGGQYGISRERIRQIEERSLARLRLWMSDA